MSKVWFNTNLKQQLKDTLVSRHLPLLSGKISLHLLLGQILGLQLSGFKRSHPGVSDGRLTGHPLSDERSIVSEKCNRRH